MHTPAVTRFGVFLVGVALVALLAAPGFAEDLDEAELPCEHVLADVIRGNGAVHEVEGFGPGESVCVGGLRFAAEVTASELLEPGVSPLGCVVRPSTPNTVRCQDARLSGELIITFDDAGKLLRVALSAGSLL